jgi:hypothetical protein
VDRIFTESARLSLKGDAEPLGDTDWRCQRSGLVERSGEMRAYLGGRVGTGRVAGAGHRFEAAFAMPLFATPRQSE